MYTTTSDLKNQSMGGWPKQVSKCICKWNAISLTPGIDLVPITSVNYKYLTAISANLLFN